MDTALIVSSTEKSTNVFRDLLHKNNYKEIVAVDTCGKARRMLSERLFDLCVINAPLADEMGKKFACDVASNFATQVILVVNNSLFEEILYSVENYGVLTISKPMNKEVFWGALKLAGATYNKVFNLKRENIGLQKKIEDIKIVDRAKCLLMEYEKISESDAHRHIEKYSMDRRKTKREIAEEIINSYGGKR